MVCVVWGTTYLAIRISLETIPPLLMAGLRWIIAGTLLIGFLKARGAQFPGPRSWPALGALGILLIGFGNGCIVWAEQTVPSGLTAVLAATLGPPATESSSKTRPGKKSPPLANTWATKPTTSLNIKA